MHALCMHTARTLYAHCAHTAHAHATQAWGAEVPPMAAASRAPMAAACPHPWLQACGTLDFMAPEMLADDPAYEAKADVWSAGVLVYMLLSGIHPFRGPSQCATEERIKAGHLPSDRPGEGLHGASAEAQQIRFDIPPQPLTDALTLFGRQSGMQVSADAGLLRDRSSPGVSGTMSPADALAQLLAGTGVAYRLTDGKTAMLYAAGSADGAILPLDELMAKDPGFRREEFYPAIIDQFRYRGKLYGLAKDFSTLVVYFNKDLFDKWEVPYPKAGWTWKNWLTVLSTPWMLPARRPGPPAATTRWAGRRRAPMLHQGEARGACRRENHCRRRPRDRNPRPAAKGPSPAPAPGAR